MNAVRWFQGPFVAVSAAATLAMLTGCSSSDQATSSSSPPAAAAAAPGVSPEGVTTSVSAPTNSTEEEYYRACVAAREWMAQKPGDPHAHVETYLAMVQASPTGSEGTWGTPWAEMHPERQAALIFAAYSAADGGCPE